jgi:hypothetical protein
MEEKLDFSIPEKKQKSSTATKLLVVLALVLVGLALANLLTALRRQGPARETEVYGLSAEQAKQLASRLAQRRITCPGVK